MTLRKTLAGKQIVVGITGSIAAVEMVKVIHALRRRGADVCVVMSPAASGIVTPDAMTYASGKPAVTRLTGMVEHISSCGDGGSADLLLIAPCTANTIGKIANGIDDTTVTTFATTALGSKKPIVVVPAMHHSMYRHPAVLENIRRIKGWGVTVIEPFIEEGKAKIVSTEEIVLTCERALLRGPLSGKRVLITSGPCRETVDDVRVLTTRSGGQMGRELAYEAFRLGADVTVVHADTLPCVTNLPAVSATDMHKQVLRQIREQGADVYLSAAAISDYAPEPVRGKIPSGMDAMTITCNPLPKLLDDVLALKAVPVVVAFKIGYDIKNAADAMLSKGVALVAMNSPETMGNEQGEYIIKSGEQEISVRGTKEECAAGIFLSIKNHPDFRRTLNS
jgi:phosphopantothenoylcysteine decarboxylase/phosphopantothenate--cysteine ligase